MQQTNLPIIDSSQYLSFTVDDEEYCVDILRVQEIRKWQPVRPLLDTPAYVKGVLELRGDIVPIIDLRSRFNLSPVEYTPTTVIIVLSAKTAEHKITFGIVVDGVSEVLEITPLEIRNAPDLGTKIDISYMAGSVTLNNRMLILLDIDRILSQDVMGAF